MTGRTTFTRVKKPDSRFIPNLEWFNLVPKDIQEGIMWGFRDDRPLNLAKVGTLMPYRTGQSRCSCAERRSEVGEWKWPVAASAYAGLCNKLEPAEQWRTSLPEAAGTMGNIGLMTMAPFAASLFFAPADCQRWLPRL
jgi:hypothetical protein